MEREKIDMIYENVGDFRTQTDVSTNRQQPLQSTGSERVKMRCYRSAIVCLVLLCVLLLTAVIVLCVLINTNNQQFNIKTKNITEERDQLRTKYINITEERDQLLTKYTNITEEREQLLTKYTKLTEERDQLLLKSKNLATENERLLNNNNNINKQREQLTQQKNTLMEILKADGWKEYKSSLYFISSEEKSWTESRSYCRERGADLIIINNRQEEDFIEKIAVQNKHWIGLSDIDEEDRWKWVDGSTLNSDFWHTGEPNGGRTENCALKHSSVWADYTCNDAYNYICEKNNFK